jgi:hypothetical protein
MSTLETRRRQATVDRLIDDLRRLVEQERDDRQPGDETHQQAERLRWDIAKLVKSTTNEHAASGTETEQRNRLGLAGSLSPSRRSFRRVPAG